MPVIRHGLAYNDVLLVPRYSRVRSRNEVDLSTVIAPGIALAVPLLSPNHWARLNRYWIKNQHRGATA